MRLFLGIYLLPCVITLAATGQSKAAENVEAEASAEARDPTERTWDFWLSAVEEYRGRFSGQGGGSQLVEPLAGESDHDVRLYLDGSVASPHETLRLDLAAGLWWDVDGNLPDGSPSSLGSQFDYRQPWFDAYRLSLDWRAGRGLRLLRVGRQPTEHGPALAFDGAAAELEAIERKLFFFAFGGRTVYFFEAGAGSFEDWLGSLGLTWLVDGNWRAELDYRLQVEEVSGANQQGREGLLDHSVGFAAWYRREDRVISKFWLRTQNRALAQIGLRGSYFWPAQEAGLDYLVSGQPATLRQIHENEDPYFAILGESRPHLRWRLDGWKGWRMSWTFLALHLGTDGRRLFERNQETAFNRNTGRVYALVSLEDLAIPGLYLSAAAEAHFAYEDGHLDSSWIFTASGSAGYRCPSKRHQIEVGTNYQRYRLDYYRDLREVEDVRTVYLMARTKILDWLSLKLRYEYESAERDYHTVILALQQSW